MGKSIECHVPMNDTIAHKPHMMIVSVVPRGTICSLIKSHVGKRAHPGIISTKMQNNAYNERRNALPVSEAQMTNATPAKGINMSNVIVNTLVEAQDAKRR